MAFFDRLRHLLSLAFASTICIVIGVEEIGGLVLHRITVVVLRVRNRLQHVPWPIIIGLRSERFLFTRAAKLQLRQMPWYRDLAVEGDVLRLVCVEGRAKYIEEGGRATDSGDLVVVALVRR
uniref:Putative secreted protein n=1 Tax=Anopheles darlingi TaxID=43151 RepID=A0A2M4DEH3_ANODA